MATPIHLTLWIDLVVEAVVCDLVLSTSNGGRIHADGLAKAMPVTGTHGSLEAYVPRSDGKCTQSGK